MIPKDFQDKESILSFLKTRTSRPVSLGEIVTAIGISRKDVRTIKRLLKVLIKSGDVLRTRTGLYGLADKMNLVTGVFEAHRDGYGFVIPDKPGERDLFIPPRRTSAAMSGDHVVARIESEARREGSIIRILRRAQKRVVGILCRDKNYYYVKPKSKRIPFDIYVSPKDRADARSGDVVVVELTSYPTTVRPPEGKVLKVMHEVDEPHLEIEMITEEYSLTSKFSASVNEEVKRLTEEVNFGKRVDCRGLLTVTVDGETAKDFDDAISINKTEDGYTLFVHIADVSHYVPWDSILDLEARRRGTSVYFPGKVIPMLPKRLSNDLCSLLPKTDRLTFTVELKFDRTGQVMEKDFYPSVINSDERMTYTSVKKILLDHDPHEREKYDYLLESLETMEELCELLRERRVRRGSLDFDLPEPEVLLDIQGKPEAIIKAERNLSHMIIEEFMIVANEAVAAYLQNLGVPSLYRIHEKPDTSKLEELKSVFNAFGLQTKKLGHSAFHSILRQVKETPQETLFHILLLRSLKQAKYSTENIGHFGLHSECYAHFTSPIRRYPDLVVHRILKDSIGKNRLLDKKRFHLERLLPDIAIHSSKTERAADEAERDVVDAMRVWLMKDKVGNEYEGIVISVSSYGLKVQLKDFFVEDFLHVSLMSDDYYRFDEKSYRLLGRRTKKAFTIGTEVHVRIERVDTWGREILMAMV